LPLTVRPSTEARDVEERAPHAILATVTGARKGVIFDAWLDDHFASTLLDALGTHEQTRTRRGAIRATPTAEFAELRGTEPLRVSRPGAEQSNTSLIYGDRLIMKLFRRIEPGINPDFEISRQLSEKAGFNRVPAVGGAFEYERPGDPVSTFGMVQQLVESQADGWRHATDDLSRFYDQVAGHEPPPLEAPGRFSELSAATPPQPLLEAMASYLGPANRLGRRTGDMHVALASDAGDPAFAPEPFNKEDLAALSADAVGQAQRAMQLLEFRLRQAESAVPDGQTAATRLPDDVAEQARRLSGEKDVLIDRIRSAVRFEFTATKTRVHGDYHLGQVLWSEGDFYLLDFEGEPARPLAQRRQKQSPLKDVAGMLRSFSYAAYAALFTRTTSRPADFPRLEPWARHWQTWASAAFLKGFFDVAGGATFLPGELTQRDALLRLFMLDKALYELNYELNTRPDWVRIPLWGIFDLL
jgi:maltose alpha-D-glucosyltransferase/alpha-amylase